MKVQKSYVFLRDDDVACCDRRFSRFFSFCLKAGLPVVYGVIPKLLTKKTARFLYAQKKEHPRLFDIVQHGWRHAAFHRAGRRFEFGTGRSYARQKKDMTLGLDVMRSAFGGMATPAFIPPFNEYDLNTLKAAQNLGMKVFCVGDSRVSLYNRRMLVLPTVVSVNTYDRFLKSQPLELPPKSRLQAMGDLLSPCNF
jgi:peptidoglycan/xylan/chitin deacetylase (PgdA/CDA1 family)